MHTVYIPGKHFVNYSKIKLVTSASIGIAKTDKMLVMKIIREP